MNNAPTTRETADHAELAAWFRSQGGRHRPNAAKFISAADALETLLSEIAALRGRAEEADALASTHFVALREKQDDAAILKHGKLEAERQRDELRKALDYARYHVLQSPCSDKQACLDQIDQAIANQGADHSALIERLEAHDGLHDRGCDGRNYACTCGDDDKGEALLKEAAAALRDQQSKMQMMQARLDRWEPKPFCGPSFSSSFLTGQAEQPSDASRTFRPAASSASPLPSAPNQAKEAGE